LTGALNGAPHGIDLLEKFPLIGELVDGEMSEEKRNKDT
jgi:predicted heme/steroid binding protein